jgi:branched-chain amino acid transport system permease protein
MHMEIWLIVLSSGLLVGGIYAFVAVGLNLVFGVIRVANFAHGEFVMLGMFSAYLAYEMFNLDPYISAWLLVAPASFLLGVVIYYLVISRLLDDHFMQMFATFGLILVIQNIVLWLTRGEPRTVYNWASTSSFRFAGIDWSLARVVMLLVALVISGLLMLFLRTSIMGISMRAVAQDMSTSSLIGINVKRVFLVTFALSTMLAGIAGALLTPSYAATPSIGFGFVLPAFAVVVLGGMGSIPGSVIGGLAVGLIEASAGYLLSPQLKQAVWFTIFLAILVIRPNGLFGRATADTLEAR